MTCEKTSLIIKVCMGCGSCKEVVDWCDRCIGDPAMGEDWWCYDEGRKHYCDKCWQEIKHSKRDH